MSGRAAAVALLVLAVPLFAQEPRVGMEPAVVTVGEPFHLVVESLADRGARLELSVALDSAGPFEVTGARGADPAGGLAWVDLVAWRTGPAASLTGTLRVTTHAGDSRAVPLRFTTPVVRSVLPSDSGRFPPRPPRDVIGPDREPVWWLIGGAAAALLALLALVLRRRRTPPALRRGAADPRSDALRQLDRLRARGLLERGEVARFYEETAEVLRGFAAAWALELSRDLTSAELVDRLRAAAAPGVSALAEVLDAADRAKFARGAHTPGEALRDWEIARAWVAEERPEAAP